MVVQAGLVQPFVRRFGERRGVLAGLSFGTVGFTIFGLATTGSFFLLGLPLMALWGLFGPSAQSLMTRYVAPTDQGKLQGADQLGGITGMFGPMLFTTTFAFFIETRSGIELPGARFLLAASLLLAAALLARRVTRERDGTRGQG